MQNNIYLALGVRKDVVADWWHAIRAGATVSEVRAFRRECLEPSWLKVFGKDLGIGREEDFRYYVKAREAGATHAEIMEVVTHGAHVASYSAIRGAGATHAEAMEAVLHRVSGMAYAEAGEAGATHAEIMEAARRGPFVNEYSALRCNGIGHTEGMEAMCLTATVQTYLAAREAGATHAEVMSASRVPGSLLNNLRTLLRR